MSKQKQTTLELRLKVRFDKNGTSTEELENNLRFIANHAHAEGLLSGDTEAEVDWWEFDIVEVKS